MSLIRIVIGIFWAVVICISVDVIVFVLTRQSCVVVLALREVSGNPLKPITSAILGSQYVPPSRLSLLINQQLPNALLPFPLPPPHIQYVVTDHGGGDQDDGWWDESSCGDKLGDQNWEIMLKLEV